MGTKDSTGRTPSMVSASSSGQTAECTRDFGTAASSTARGASSYRMARFVLQRGVMAPAARPEAQLCRVCQRDMTATAANAAAIVVPKWQQPLSWWQPLQWQHLRLQLQMAASFLSF